MQKSHDILWQEGGWQRVWRKAFQVEGTACKQERGTFRERKRVSGQSREEGSQDVPCRTSEDF